MKLRKKINIERVLYAFLLIFMIVMTTVGIIGNTNKNLSFSQDVIYDGWNNKTIDPSTVSYTKTLDNDIEGNYICFYSRNAIVKAYIDGTEIFSFDKINKLTGKTPGSGYNFISIPNNTDGQKIEITVKHVYPRNQQLITTFLGGDKGDILNYILQKDFISIIINVFILICGVVILLLYFVSKKTIKSSTGLVFLSIFTISFALWSMSELSILQILIQNPVIEYFICYITLFTFPLSIMLYIQSIKLFTGLSKSIIRYVIDSHYILVYILLILHFIGVADLTQTLIVFHILLFIEALLTMIGLYKYIASIAKKSHEKEKKQITIGMFFFCTAVFVDIIRYTKGVADAAYYSRIVIAFYLFVLIFNIIKDFVLIIKENEKTELYKEIAFHDTLTHLRTRSALESDLNKIDLSKCTIISFDINNLKYYNDNFGHDKGDQLISSAAQNLYKVFGNKCYRMGGDEFLSIINSKNEKVIIEQIQKFNQELMKFNSTNTLNLKLEVAIGYSTYNDGDNIDSLMKNADKLMYTNKKKIKEHQRKIHHQTAEE